MKFHLNFFPCIFIFTLLPLEKKTIHFPASKSWSYVQSFSCCIQPTQNLCIVNNQKARATSLPVSKHTWIEYAICTHVWCCLFIWIVDLPSLSCRAHQWSWRAIFSGCTVSVKLTISKYNLLNNIYKESNKNPCIEKTQVSTRLFKHCMGQVEIFSGFVCLPFDL